MRFSLLTSFLLSAFLTTGCFERKEPKDKVRKGAPTKDQSGDVAFQSFVGRLQIAVQRRDLQTLSALMVPNFGYRWDDAPPGENAFMYWDRNNLWGELASLVKTRWVPYDGFMVVPAQLAEDPDYAGFRAGVRIVGGSWRFVYFVPAPPADAPESPAPTSL
jgi:hypothetical protein